MICPSNFTPPTTSTESVGARKRKKTRDSRCDTCLGKTGTPVLPYYSEVGATNPMGDIAPEQTPLGASGKALAGPSPAVKQGPAHSSDSQQGDVTANFYNGCWSPGELIQDNPPRQRKKSEGVPVAPPTKTTPPTDRAAIGKNDSAALSPAKQPKKTSTCPSSAVTYFDGCTY